MALKLAFSPYLTQIRKALDGITPRPEVYLVGGSVRDALLGRPSQDLDFIIMRRSLQTARAVADALGGAYFTLDEDFQVGRVVLNAGMHPRQEFDFVLVQGGDLQADLRNRDFTMNAMAVSLDDLDTLIDPLGGAQDLLQKKLVPCTRGAFIDDPVRVIRAVRMTAAFDLTISPEVRALIPPAAARLNQVSPERARDEFLKMLGAPRPSVSLRLLDHFGVLGLLIPEITALKGETQSPPHIYDVWEHSLHTVQALESILTLLDENYKPDNEMGGDLFSGLLSGLLGRYRQQITAHLAEQLVPDRPYRPLIFLAALLHDFTKPRHRTVEESGRIRFIGHEVSGAKQIAERGASLKLSNTEIQRLVRIMHDHMRPFQAARAGEELTKRAIHRFWRDNGPSGVDVVLVALADLRGIYGHTLTKELMESHLEDARELLEAYFEHPEVVSPPVLLDGNDLMEAFDLEPGPRIGALLDLLREAQAAGEVDSREQALEYLSAQLDQLA